jgi:hypothetical protein
MLCCFETISLLNHSFEIFFEIEFKIDLPQFYKKLILIKHYFRLYECM